MEIRVYYEDVDIGGVVYHAKYLHYCERARSELFFSRGKSPVWEGYHFVVSRIDARYHAPARFGELLEVKSSVKKLTPVRVVMDQRVKREGELLFEMEIELVCIKENRPAKIPDYFLEVLR